MSESNVSTQEQRKHGLSVDSQIEALKDYSKANKYTVVDVYNDAGISARKKYTKRPALLQLIDDCKAGKIDLILFTKLDRWFRSVADYYEVQKVLDDYKIPWRAIWEDYETETSSGVFKVNIMLSVAQSEADRTSERIKSTFEYKRAKGEYVGGNKAPVGFKRTGLKIIRDSETEKAVEAFFATYLATLSRKSAIASAESNGLHLVSPVADRMLRHPAYYGDLAYIDCTPYITLEQHEIIKKSIASAPRRHQDTGYEYMFSGLCTCGTCGSRIVGGRSVYKRKDGKQTHSIRYYCNLHEKGYNCTGASISEPRLEAFLLDSIEDKLNEYSLIVKSQRTQKSSKPNLKKKLERLKDLYVLGDIELEDYKKKRTAILQEIEAEQKQEPAQIRQLPTNWKEVYNMLDVAHKRAFWAQTVDHIVINGLSCKTPSIIF